MSNAIENLRAAQQRAMAGRPRAGGFPYLAETLRSAGVTRNLWSLPACQSLALRADQAGASTFPEFLMAAWKAGVVSYEVNLIARTVPYRGCAGESYVESYPAARL